MSIGNNGELTHLERLMHAPFQYLMGKKELNEHEVNRMRVLVDRAFTALIRQEVEREKNEIWALAIDVFGSSGAA